MKVLPHLHHDQARSLLSLLSASQLASTYHLPLLWTSSLPSSSLLPSTSLPYLKQNWNLYKTQLYSPNASTLSFPLDPFPSTSTTAQQTVLGVEYAQGSWSANPSGGLQFYSQPFPNTTTGIQTAVLTYQMALSPNWQWAKGGKLPGLFGGPVGHCSGGDHSLSCFSARLMWRPKGAGEVYAYLPTYDGFCNTGDVLCDSDYGISLSRGSYTFTLGGWTNITLLIALNTPPLNNGLLKLFVNGTQAMSHSNVVFRTDPTVTLSKLFFSTFFGGSDSSWQSPVDTHSYFRNFEVYGSAAPSNLTGVAVNATISNTTTKSAGSLSGGIDRIEIVIAMAVLVALFVAL